MNYSVSLDDMKRCLRYRAASAKRSKAIRFANDFAFYKPGKVTRKVREDVYRIIMDALDAGVSCGIYCMSDRIYCKGD